MSARNHDLRLLLEALDATISADLLDLAMMHRSYAYEHGSPPTNERLEFLGDAVLGFVVTDALYRTYPDAPEGNLAKYRAAIVNSAALADVARSLGVGDFLYLGRGEEATGGRDKSSILADTLEAVLGAAYLTGGIEAASDLILRLFRPLIDQAALLGAGLDWKTSLQERAAACNEGAPEYRVTHVGPDHAREFTAQALLNGVVRGTGTGRSKKLAEQAAAAQAYATLPDPVLPDPAQ